MPIYPISKVKRKATGNKFVSQIKNPKERKKYLGSLYAVADYAAVNPDFGTLVDLKNRVLKAHENDQIVILDWVANHTGWDHPWIKKHPDFYTHNEKGEITDPLNDDGTSKGWQDVSDLNYNNKMMRVMTFMIKGMPLTYSGQEYGLKHRMKFFEKDLIDRTNGNDFEFYTKLGRLKNNNPALNGGKHPASYQRLQVDNKKVLVFKRVKNGKEIIFIGNMSGKKQQFKLKIKGVYRDYFTGKNVDLSGKINIPAWGYYVLIK